MDLHIEQALFHRSEDGKAALQARSTGFQNAWVPGSLHLCTGFGLRPTGVQCPTCVFSQPLGRRHVAVVQVADRDVGERAEPRGLWFRILAIPRQTYEQVIGDPFIVDERFPPEWRAVDELPVLLWPAVYPRQRTVTEIQEVLKRSYGPALLGSVQILLDGGRVVFERPAPDPDLMRGLWSLLPHASRGTLWPASFAFGNDLTFHALVVPRVAPGFDGHTSESQAECYPDGSYELRLQAAAEEGDQAELDVVFTRRSARQLWRYGLVLLLVAMLLAAVAEVVLPPPGLPRQHARPAPAGPPGVNPVPKASH